MRPERIALVVNPHARMHVREGALLERMRAVAWGRASVHVTEGLPELRDLAARLAEAGTAHVLLSGGDGSLMAGVTALSEAYGDDRLPTITPIPGGTAGTVARNWRIVGRPESWVRRALERPLKIVHKPSLDVRFWPLAAGIEAERRVGFIFGTGLVASFFRLYYEAGAPGYAGAAKLVAQIFLGSFVGGELARRVLEPLPCQLEVDGRRADPEAWSLICAAVVKNLGIHMMVTHRGGDDFDRPHLVATPLPPQRLGPRAPLVLAGRPIGGPDDVDALVGRFAVSFAKEGPFVVDGELLGARRVEVSAGPRIRLALPG